jgi:glycosyltransferase involved in cell wall biosynthesis
VLVDALGLIPADLSCEVVIRGDLAADPAYVADLRRRASGDPRIRIVDRIPHSRFGEALAEVDVLVVPSIWAENAPLVLLSALQAGRYVVVSDVPGLADHVGGAASGRKFPAGDSAALAQVLIELLRDPSPVIEARAQPGGFGSFSSYLDRLERLYEAAAQGAAVRELAGGVSA